MAKTSVHEHDPVTRAWASCLRHMLERRGFDVAAAAAGADGVVLIELARPRPDARVLLAGLDAVAAVTHERARVLTVALASHEPRAGAVSRRRG